MARLLRIEETTIRWLRVVALIGFVALILEAFIVTSDGLLRAFANKPIRGLGELVDVSTAILIATCFPIGIAQRRNVRITMLLEVLSPAAQKVLDVIADIVLLAFVTIVAVELIAHAIEATRLRESTLVHQIPKGPFWSVASAILVLSIPAQFLMTLISFARLFEAKSKIASR
jgi:TRAP-type C4-dicarboxylate transport system permease small subunit